MRSLRDFLGSPCPVCRADILQRAPSKNRMPTSEEEAYCPRCDRAISVGDLNRLAARRTSFLARLFKGSRARRTV